MPQAAKIVSLRRFRAYQQYESYNALPQTLRTSERAEPVIEAIFDYAYEHVPRRRPHRLAPDITRQVSRRLDEFIPGEVAPDSLPLMEWLHENMLPEVWLSPDLLRDFVGDCLRHR